MSITETIPAASPLGTLQRHQAAAATPALPVVTPGQFWLIELPPTGGLSPATHHALDAANVVIYDRVLGDAVAQALPLGTYAEPASGSDRAAARCVRFVQDGWSVMRLMPAGLAQRERTRRMQDFVDELAAAKVPGGLRVHILAEEPDSGVEQFAARFDDLVSIVAAHPRDTRLTVVIDAFAGATRLHWVAANGLAG